jgi:hypothetical protein
MGDVDSDSDSDSASDGDAGEGMIVTFDSEVTDDDRALINHMLDTTPQYGVVERNGWVTLPVRPVSLPPSPPLSLIRAMPACSA